MIEIKPEPLEELKKRAAKAFGRLWYANHMHLPDADRPGLHMENVFDFENGVRIIASRDINQGNEFLHFSASVTENYVTEALPMSPRLYLAKFLGECCGLIKELWGIDHRDLQLIEITPEKGVPHWIVPIK
jgi:hypothetical protein